MKKGTCVLCAFVLAFSPCSVFSKDKKHETISYLNGQSPENGHAEKNQDKKDDNGNDVVHTNNGHHVKKEKPANAESDLPEGASEPKDLESADEVNADAFQKENLPIDDEPPIETVKVFPKENMPDEISEEINQEKATVVDDETLVEPLEDGGGETVQIEPPLKDAVEVLTTIAQEDVTESIPTENKIEDLNTKIEETVYVEEVVTQPSVIEREPESSPASISRSAVEQTAEYSQDPTNQNPVYFDAVNLASIALQSSMTQNVAQRLGAFRLGEGKKDLELANLATDFPLFEISGEKGGVWIQGTGTWGRYKGKGDSVGYKSTLNGFSTGFDERFGKFRLGLALNFGFGDISGVDKKFKVEMESYQATVYGSAKFSSFFIDGLVGYGQTEYNQKRMNGTVEHFSDYGSQQVVFKTSIGRNLQLNPKTILVPYGSIYYGNVSIDGYQDTSGLSVQKQRQQTFQTQVGGTVYRTYKITLGPRILPYVRVEVAYDFETTSDVQSVDMTKGLVQESSKVSLGKFISRGAMGLSLISKGDYRLSAEYEYEYRKRYQSHTGTLKARMMF